MESSIRELKVLLVDDNLFMLELLEHSLIEIGVRHIAKSENGAEAIHHLKANNADVMVLDLNMPEMDGISLLRELKKLPYPPSVLIASSMEKAVIDAAKELVVSHGLDLIGAMRKPVNRDMLSDFLTSKVVEKVTTKAEVMREVTAEEIDDCIMERRIETYYLPKVDLANGRFLGVEALARMRTKEGEIIGAASFIATAKRYAQISSITVFVMEDVIKALKTWRQTNQVVPVSVNLSISDLEQYDLPEHMEQMVIDAGFDPSIITFEIPETSLINDVNKSLEVLSRLRMKGFGLAIDDFGIGAGSLQQLKRFPFTELKIDRSFVQNVDGDPKALAMLQIGVNLARRLGLKITAEGAERVEELRVIKKLGCDYVQGFYISKPKSMTDITEWIEGWHGFSDEFEFVKAG